MKKSLFALTLLAFCFVAALPAQERAPAARVEFKGMVKDVNSAVFAGIPVFFKKNDEESSVSTDISGRFSVLLAPGNYEVTVRKTLSEKFRAFVSIQENGLNPNNVEFVIEPNPVCCGALSEKPYPKITKLPKPPYPAAARAVRAGGEVVVDLKIDRAGRVISAEAVGGHPLLRAASVTAAKEALFEESAGGGDDEPREVKLTFVFLQTRDEKEFPRRYSNIYRVEVIDSIEIILATTNYQAN